jgi:guanylate kinase
MAEYKSPLKKLGEFERILKHYNPSLEILDLLRDVQFVLLAAPTAAGRNTIIKNLIMTGKYYYVVSDTTRKPRINNGIPEKNGYEYWFKSEDEFLNNLKNGAYIEAAIVHNQQVSGISLNEMRKAAESGKIAITDIDINGCDSIKSYSDSTIPIFILPPDFKEWMHRLDTRGAMDRAEKRRRLNSAAEEIQLALERNYFKFVINWDLRLTIEELHEHIASGDFGVTEQAAAHSHAKQVLADLAVYLKA